jgi:hypothetical protein
MTNHEWKFLGNGTWMHPSLGRVFLNEDGRTYRATIGDYRNVALNINGNAIRFRSRGAAIAYLARLKERNV